MNFIGLDIEATDKGEILELSIIRFIDNFILYHSYFKPDNSKSWSTDVHHITVEIVRNAPTFKTERNKVQRILNECEGIIGFAVNNDLKYLENNGVFIPSEKVIIEVQDWFWYYHGKNIGIEFGTVPRLSKCAELFGFDFNEESDAHSATNDTLVTLSIFKKIIQCNFDGEITKKIIEIFKSRLEKEKERNMEVKAKGVLILEIKNGGYILKNHSTQCQSDGEYYITVQSRYIAEHEIREKFRKREIAPNSGIYKLKKQILIFL